MRLAQIENGVVLNVIEAEERPDWAAEWPEAGEAGPGWVVDGGQLVAPPAPEAAPPQVVSAMQAKAALHLAGLLPQVEAVIAASDPLVQIFWAQATEFRRDSPTIAALAGGIGLDAAAIDALFIVAVGITA